MHNYDSETERNQDPCGDLREGGTISSEETRQQIHGNDREEGSEIPISFPARELHGPSRQEGREGERDTFRQKFIRHALSLSKDYLTEEEIRSIAAMIGTMTNQEETDLSELLAVIAYLDEAEGITEENKKDAAENTRALLKIIETTRQ